MIYGVKKVGIYNVVIADSKFHYKYCSNYSLQFFDDRYHEGTGWEEFGQPCASSYDLVDICTDTGFLNGEHGLDIWGEMWTASSAEMEEISNWALDIYRKLR